MSFAIRRNGYNTKIGVYFHSSNTVKDSLNNLGVLFSIFTFAITRHQDRVPRIDMMILT